MSLTDGGLANPVARRMGLASGTLLVFGAEALALPTALLVAALLTRHLGVEDYGRFALLATVVAWVQWSLSSVWSRATIKLVSEADDWRPVGDAAARLSLGAGLAAALCLALLSVPLAHLFHEPTLALPLALFALDIPLFCLAYAHRSLLIGIGNFPGRAAVTVGRSLFRFGLITVLVLAGFGIIGAISGSIGASIAELMLARLYIRPRLTGSGESGGLPTRKLWEAAGPLLIYALSLRLFDRLDLFVLKAMGGTAYQAGLYSAAQNIALLPGIFAMSFVPSLLAAVSQAHRQDRDFGEEVRARALVGNALRATLLLLPLGAVVAGCAGEIVSFFFGAEFAGAAPLLGPLFFASLLQAVFAASTAILMAGDRVWWTALLGGAMPLLALAALLLVIPAFGMFGAAGVTLAVSTVATLAALYGVWRRWGVLPPGRSLARVVLTSGLVFALATMAPRAVLAGVTSPLLFLLLKGGGLAMVIPLTYTLLGEWRERFQGKRSFPPGGPA